MISILDFSELFLQTQLFAFPKHLLAILSILITLISSFLIQQSLSLTSLLHFKVRLPPYCFEIMILSSLTTSQVVQLFIFGFYYLFLTILTHF